MGPRCCSQALGKHEERKQKTFPQSLLCLWVEYSFFLSFSLVFNSLIFANLWKLAVLTVPCRLIKHHQKLHFGCSREV